MAFYKQTCIHCGTIIDRDAAFCPACGSDTPFWYRCPTCLRQVEKGHKLCAGCGRELTVKCPKCEGMTFVQNHCEACGADLTVPCVNKRCRSRQFFQNTVCTACGKKIKG